MGYIFLFLAIFLLTFGHFLKTIRWKKFVDIYEMPNEKNLIRGLSIGYILNFILPFRFGDIFRIIYSGKKMKNGIAFSFGTILIDRYLDIIMVGLIFILFLLFGIDNTNIFKSAMFYIFLSLLFLFIAFISILLNKHVKKIIKNIASIFNKKIRFRIFKFIWSFITLFKDVIFNINKIKLILLTLTMWTSYLLSYFCMTQSLNSFGSELDFIELFILLFSESSLSFSSLESIVKLTNIGGILLFIYLIMPLIFLLIYTYLRKFKFEDNKKRLELIPQIDEYAKLDFLENYFSGENREYINNYLKINRDITIIKDCSAGSNAKTILCSYDNKKFYRKFAFNDESEKLKKQVDWLLSHNKKLFLTDIESVNCFDNYFYYDMPYKDNAINYFDYIHSHTDSNNIEIFDRILNDLKKKLYTNIDKINKKDLENYINDKVIKNLNVLRQERVLKHLLKYDFLNINGRKYKNLNLLEKYLTFDNLYSIFKNDIISDMHGDLTIENIICLNNIKSKPYYIIDPNVDVTFSSSYLDYAKLLQSLHGGYEFLSRIENVSIENNNINYMFLKSNSYEKLYENYLKYLGKNFSEEAIKSIYFHEIIHWIRLLPYKLKKSNTQFLIAYSRFIIILNEVIDMYGGEIDEK